jgi:hypothetical protein
MQNRKIKQNKMNTESYLKDLKKKAMSQKRPVIFDNDGGDALVLCKGTSKQDLINVRTKPALDAGVDTFVYTTGGCMGIGLHDSKVGSTLKTKEGHLSKNLVGNFIRNGTDCLRINSEYVKNAGKELFWGMRMNDTHDAGNNNIFMPENRFKNDNPDVMFGKKIKYGANTAVDYLNQKVRDFAVDYIMDVVDNYDIDGIFLDFFRHPIFFRSNANGLVATEEEITAMNAFMRCVKNELDKRRIADKKYYIISIRIPDSVEYCYDIGLDIATWLKDGLADILSTTGYMDINDCEYSVQLSQKYKIPVYLALDESRVKNEFSRHKRNSVRAYYGRIMNAWTAGYDGVLMFNNAGLRDMKLNIEQNWFSKDAGSYQEGLIATLKGKEFVNTLSKSYFVSFKGAGSVPNLALPHEHYIDTPTLNHDAPIVINKGEHIDVAIRISDDIKSAQKHGKKPSATVSIFMLGDPDSINVLFNSSALNTKASINQYADLESNETEYILKADISIDLIKMGKNIFSFAAIQKINLLDMWIDLDYPEKITASQLT